MNAKSIIFNELTEKKNHAANFICLITKQYIYKNKCQNRALSIQELKALIRNIENTEKYIAEKNGKLGIHRKKWNRT